MRKLLLFISAMFVWMCAFSQGTLPYTDDFETYTVGGYLAVQNTTWWTTWSNLPGSAEDGQISTAFAHSGTKSVLCDEVPTPATDQIMKLGNKTTGAYELKFWAYIETGKCAYYNIQHYQDPGTQWAFEVYFRTSGAGELLAGSATAWAFTYPKDTWFEVRHLIDLDNDNIKLYINNVLVHEWPFHYQPTGTVGLNQLGGVDFYAGAKSGTTEVPKYFFDDVSFSSYVAPTEPIIGVTPTSLSATLQTGQTQVKQVTVSNTGNGNLVYSANVILNSDAPGVNQVAIIEGDQHRSSISLSNCSADPNPQPSPGPPETDATAILHYDGANASAIGWNSPPITVTVAARFPNNMTLPNAGMSLQTVEVYVNELNATASNLMTVKIFGPGTTYQPGALIASKDFTPLGAAWETITLDSPVLVTGADLWIGYTFTQTDAGIYIPGTDAGPNDPNGDFLSTGVGWSHLSNNPALLRNWNIRGNLSGTPFQQWLSVAPLSGTVIPSGNQVLDVTFNSTNLAIGTYTGLVRILSNDLVTPQVDIPVTLDVVASACPAPTGLAVTNITSSSASIGWVGAPQVEIDYAVGAHTAGTGTIVTAYVSPYGLTGLTPLTSYQVYIRQICGIGNNSTWAGPLNFSTPEQYVTTVYPMTDGTGYVTNGSFLKKGPWLNTSLTAVDTLGRGYVKFDISSLPANAIITKATLNYYNFYRNGTSTAVNYIFPLASDPVTAAGAALYTDCGDGPAAWGGVWDGAAPQWFNSSLNADGFNYISSKIASGWAGFGFVRSSTAVYRFSGLNDATYKPYLGIEYHIPTAPILSMTPATKDFETVNLGIQSLPQTFTIKNTGTGAIMIDGFSMGGTDASQFILTNTNPAYYNLVAGASITVTVYFKPTSVGVKTANLIVTREEVEYNIPLTGTGYLNGPQSLTATPVIGPFVNLAWAAPLPLVEIRYDDNTVESNFYNGTNSTTNMRYYTKITIPVDGTLTNIGVYTLPVEVPTTWQSISLCPDLGGLPNLAAPIQSFASVPITTTGSQWVLQTLTPYPVTAGQNYYIVCQWPNAASGAVAVATDTHNNHFRCGSTPNGGVSWGITNGNYLMRAYMTVAGDNSSNEPIVLTSGNAADGMQNAPLINANAEPKPLSLMNAASVMASAVIAPNSPNRSFTNYTVHRGTATGVYTTTFAGISGTTYQDITTSPTTTYYYMVSAEYSNGVANSNQASVTTFELCPVPSSLTVSGVTTTSANLGWNPNGTTAWEIEWGPAGFIHLSGGTMITSGVTNPYPLTGLTSGMSYSYYVRSSCDGGLFSSWAGPFTFTTVCGSFPAPISEDFEGTTFPPTCWNRTLATYTWERSTDASGYGVGTASAFADFYNFPAATTFDLMTLNFNTTGMHVPVLKFDYAYATYSASYVDQMDVYYSTNAGVSYTLLLAMPGGTTGILNTGGIATDPFIPTSAEWATQTLTLPAGTNMIKFTGISAYGNSLYLDNVKIEATPVPENLAVSGTVLSGQSICYNATNTITVAGTSTYTVQSGGSAIFIAAQKISFLPGTTVVSGAYMLGKISTAYCGDAPMMPAVAAGLEETPFSLEQTFFTLYPNPTNGNFTLVQKGDRQYGNVKVEVYGMRGNKVLSAQMIGEKKHEFATSDLPAGLYFVKLVADDYTETIKLIKTR
jgi:hypothetical protein